MVRAGKACGTIHTQLNGGGDFETLKSGAAEANPTGKMNDKIQSVVVNPGCTMTLHQNPNYGGESRQCVGDAQQKTCNFEPKLEWGWFGATWNPNFQNQASSWKCQCEGGDEDEGLFYKYCILKI